MLSRRPVRGIHAALVLLVVAAFAARAAWAASRPSPLAPAPETLPLYRLDREGVDRVAEADPRRMSAASYLRAVDGDTVLVRIEAPRGGLRDEESIRVIGIDTPERDEPGFAAAAAALDALCRASGGELRLAFDRELRDKYGRLLAHVFLRDGRSLALELIRSGHSEPYLDYPFALMDEYAEAGRNP